MSQDHCFLSTLEGKRVNVLYRPEKGSRKPEVSCPSETGIGLCGTVRTCALTFAYHRDYEAPLRPEFTWSQ